jgi:predicted  nucleic acid-binding Zn-ribbon protein
MNSLYLLQTLDLAIAQIHTRLKEIESLLAGDEMVIQARSSLEAAENALKPWLTRSRDLDLEIKSVVQKGKNAESLLYGGTVHNHKELQDLEHEVAAHKKRQSQLEDEQLEVMLKIDESQAAVAKARQALEVAQAAWANSQSSLLMDKQKLEGELAGMESQRRQTAATIDAEQLTIYETLRPKKHGRAVSLLEGDTCTTCGVEQTSILAQQVRQSHGLVYCANCGRILIPA